MPLTTTPTGRIAKVCEDCKVPFLTPLRNPQVGQCKECWDKEAADCAALFVPQTETAK